MRTYGASSKGVGISIVVVVVLGLPVSQHRSNARERVAVPSVSVRVDEDRQAFKFIFYKSFISYCFFIEKATEICVPIDPKTGPGSARFFVNQIAIPSPNRCDESPLI